MNPNKKFHLQSPFVKCKTKRINSEQKKTIKGTFIAEVNIQEVCDETSEEGGSWMTMSEKSKSTGNDDVFKSSTTAVSEAEDNIHSPTETFRRSENQQDDAWSLSHMREDSIASSTKGAVDDILPSPRRCSSSGSEENQKYSNRSAAPKVFPVSPHIEEMKDCSSMLPWDEINETVIEYSHEAGKESKFPHKSSERHSKGIFDSTRIADPEIGTTLPPRFEWGDLSSISTGSYQSSQHVSTKKLKSTEKGILSKKFSGKMSVPKVQRKKPSLRVEFKHDVRKTITEETPSSFTKEPPNLHSAIQKKNLKDDKQEKLLCTPKRGAIRKFPKRDIFSQGESRLGTTQEIVPLVGPFNKDRLKKSFSVNHVSTTSESLEPTNVIEIKESARSPLLNTFTENASKSAEAASIIRKDGSQSKKTSECELLERKLKKTKDSHDSLQEKSLSAAVFSIPTEGVPSESVENMEISSKTSKKKKDKSLKEIIERDGNKSKKIAAEKLLKRGKNLCKIKARDCSLKEKSLAAAPLSMATVNLIPSESAESIGAPSAKSSKESEAKSSDGPATLIKDSHKVKKTSATTLKKNLHKRKEKPLKEKRLLMGSSVSSKDSIRNFIESTEHEESIEKLSSNTSEKNYIVGTDSRDSEDSWIRYAASKLKKRKETCFKIRKPLEDELEEELEEDIASSSTTFTEDSTDYMDTTEERNVTEISENSTEKFLEELGLNESEQSTEAESTKSKKRKKTLKKRKFRKDPLEEKSLEVRLREYKEYLRTIPICDLSLKKWRDSKDKNGD